VVTGSAGELGTNLVRRERKLPEAACLAADERFSMVEAL